MPLLRYKTGDISAIELDRCRCGRNLRRIRNVTTKAEDIIVSPSGALLSPSILTHAFKPFTSIIKSQIVQEKLDRVDVKIVATPEFGPEKEEALSRELRNRLGKSILVSIEKVTDIPPETSGKFRWVISKVDHPSNLDW